LRKAFFQAADFKIAVAASVFSGLTMGFITDTNPMYFTGATLAAGLIYTNFICRAVEKLGISVIFGRNALHEKSIDTLPDKGTQSSPDDMLRADRLESASKAVLKRSLFLHGGGSIVAGAMFGPAFTIFQLMLAAPVLARDYFAIQRFQKVTQGDWAIIDTPPLQKVTQTEKEKAPLVAQPQPTPSA
jgi:hypothetical protein